MMIFILKKDDDENSLFFYQAVSLFRAWFLFFMSNKDDANTFLLACQVALIVI